MTNHTATATAQTIAVRSTRQRTWHRAGNWSTTDPFVLADVLAKTRRAFKGDKVITVSVDQDAAPTFAEDYSATTTEYRVVTDWDLPEDLQQDEVAVPDEPYSIDRLEAGGHWTKDVVTDVPPAIVRLILARSDNEVTRVSRPDLWTYGHAFFVTVPAGADGNPYDRPVEMRIRTRSFGPSETYLSS
jgi:hypothetical protein